MDQSEMFELTKEKGSPVKVLLAGGGSGGHITPLLAIAKQLKKDQSSIEVHTVGERFGKFNHLLSESSDIDQRHYIFAGKFRRYHRESWWKRFTDIKTIILNIRDTFLILLGLLGSVFLLIRVRPGVVFIKGGYVGVPVGLASRLLRIPYVTHDSDATAGLTNRLIGSGAKFNAVGTQNGKYSYDKKKIIVVGVPIASEYVEGNIEKDYEVQRQKLGVNPDQVLVLVLGGSNGARRLDEIMHSSLKEVISNNPDIQVIHQVGDGNELIYDDFDNELRSKIKTSRFLNPLSPYAKAADLIISRAGATAIAELAAIKKPVIFVPHPDLTGGHQVSNAQALSSAGAAQVINESEARENPGLMTDAINDLLKNPQNRKAMSQNLAKTIPKDAARRISQLIISVGERKNL